MGKNLQEQLLGVSECKEGLSKIVSEGQTKIITRNSKLASIIMPYDEYTKLQESAEAKQLPLHSTGESIVLPNGSIVKTMTEVDIPGGCLHINLYQKMQMGDWNLNYTLTIPFPHLRTSFTIPELMELYSDLTTNETEDERIERYLKEKAHG